MDDWGPESTQPPGPWPHPGSQQISVLIEQILAEYGWPANPKNAARAGYTLATKIKPLGKIEFDTIKQAASNLGIPNIPSNITEVYGSDHKEFMLFWMGVLWTEAQNLRCYITKV